VGGRALQGTRGQSREGQALGALPATRSTRRDDGSERPFKIAQTPGVVFILFEEFNHYRQVFTDGRGLPKVTNPAWFCYSVGKWEGDMFVVDTIGFNDKSWLDDPGHPHTEALRVTEKFTRRDFGHLEIQITIDDPKAYTRPWTVNARFDLVPDSELIENICENERDTPHLVGK